MPVFDGYLSKASFDEAYDAQQRVRKGWQGIIDAVEHADLEGLRQRQADIDWHLKDNGVTYNVYSANAGSTNRSWSLDPIPFALCETEWEHIKAGIRQRARLLNLVFKDIYGAQRLLKENVVPAEVIFGHKGFSTELFGFGEKENFNLYFYALDMARGPDGKMWVIGDNTQAPSGLGYALENRLTINAIAQELYSQIPIKKLHGFFADFKALLANLGGGDLSSVALLTPGPFNETYFEHAYLSSYFQINLLQGEDLLSKNGALWLKSLSGLTKITTLLRRIDDRYCDPLELKNDSRLGVAGLVESMRQDNLGMVNPVGSAVLENIGLNPFMDKIARYFFQEELILPQIATWWCGQKKELDFVLGNLDGLLIKKIDRAEEIRTYFGRKLSAKEREKLRAEVLRNPYQYVAQEEISFSTAPYYANGAIEPRSAVIRAFGLKKGDDYTVMDGGLVRVSAQKDTLLVSSQRGSTSKDLWILGNRPEEPGATIFIGRQYVETSIDKIPTPKAENLFWLGRYLARSVTTTRLILHVIKKITNFYRYDIDTTKASQDILQKALTHLTMTYPGFLDTAKERNLKVFPMREIASVIKNTGRAGSLAFTFMMLSGANLNLKDLLAFESWKLFDKMQKEWNAFIARQNDSTLLIANELESFLVYLMAYKELVSESIFKEQGLILYDIGYRIESALLLIAKARAMICLRMEKAVGHDVFEGLLNSIESFNAYRAHYKSSMTLENVVDLLVFNPQFPKSLTYITHLLFKEFKLLPKAKPLLTSYEAPIAKASQLLRSATAKDLTQIKETEGIYIRLDALLSELSDLYLECSEEFSNTYFSHYDE